ncbi:PEPxxWA-CTERM sorting domain-containing protein [uncultured Croceicoccus sp.]|uniref:PEPxxWA-CTERM sorting domain-containing protein n=1 Tax=uncultured Croceicoccus sp. TaxID=1295329 RepID=UPI0026186EDD|nr:PEPxxWA-CTERM sorting domain-containing protein [uncultured Croceicoccus sp.]
MAKVRYLLELTAIAGILFASAPASATTALLYDLKSETGQENLSFLLRPDAEIEAFGLNYGSDQEFGIVDPVATWGFITGFGKLSFWRASYGGGFRFSGPDIFDGQERTKQYISVQSTSLFTGSASTPNYKLGTFKMSYMSHNEPKMGYWGTLSVSSVGSTPYTPGAVPEPSTWAMMLLGFGAIGYAMRRRQKIATQVSYAN